MNNQNDMAKEALAMFAIVSQAQTYIQGTFDVLKEDMSPETSKAVQGLTKDLDAVKNFFRRRLTNALLRRDE